MFLRKILFFAIGFGPDSTAFMLECPYFYNPYDMPPLMDSCATLAVFENTCAWLRNSMQPGDTLWLITYDHGDRYGPGLQRGYLCCMRPDIWEDDWDALRDSSMARMLNIPGIHIRLFMDQCYSGAMRAELEAIPDIASITMHGASEWNEWACTADDWELVGGERVLNIGSENELWPEWTWWPWPNPDNPTLPPAGRAAETFCHLQRAFTGFRSTNIPADIMDIDFDNSEIPLADLNLDGKISMQESFTYDTTWNTWYHVGAGIPVSTPWLSDNYGLADEIVMLDYPNCPEEFEIRLAGTPDNCTQCHISGAAIHWMWDYRPASENVDSFKTNLLDYSWACMRCHDTPEQYGEGNVQILPATDSMKWVHRIPDEYVADSSALIWDLLPIPKFTSNCPDSLGQEGYFDLLGMTSKNEYWTLDLDSGHTYHCAVQSYGTLIRDFSGIEGTGTVFYTSERTDFEVVTYNGSLPPPETIVTVHIQNTDVILLWDEVPEALHYHVYRSNEADGGFQHLDDVAAPVHSYTDSDAISSSQRYFYYITVDNE